MVFPLYLKTFKIANTLTSFDAAAFAARGQRKDQAFFCSSDTCVSFLLLLTFLLLAESLYLLKL